MSAAHTPGPWGYVGRDRGIDAGAGERGWFVEVSPRRHVSVQGRTGDEAEANARLIAAAPELLDALKEMVRWYAKRETASMCVSGGEGLQPIEAQDDEVQAAMRAIAKAQP